MKSKKSGHESLHAPMPGGHHSGMTGKGKGKSMPMAGRKGKSMGKSMGKGRGKTDYSDQMR